MIFTFPINENFKLLDFLQEARNRGIVLFADSTDDIVNGYIEKSNTDLIVNLCEESSRPLVRPKYIRLTGELKLYKKTLKHLVEKHL